MLTRLINGVLRPAGVRLARVQKEDARLPAELTKWDVATVQKVRPYSATSGERLAALIKAVRYVVAAGIPGDFVECGVWRGGSMMAVALTLMDLNVKDRHLHLFDTYEGMPPPGAEDVDFTGQSAESQREATKCYAALEGVQEALKSTGYPMSHMHFIKGKVEDTIPGSAPAAIALLRLDTDWYESTAHELLHLFPVLQRNGVLIIDDFGHWQGARRAVEEYFQKTPMLLNAVDYTGRVGIKTELNER